MTEKFDVMIIGAGAAGLSAGIYTARSKLSTLILNQGAIGGQMTLTHEVANYPGVPVINGYSLAISMKSQAKSFGCKIKSNIRIIDYQLKDDTKTVTLSDGRSFSAKAMILALGGSPRSLELPGEELFRGKGISFCATCDGDFFTGKNLIVVGGGNSALEEAVELSKYANHVTIVHQFDHFQAFNHAIQEAKSNPKIDFIMESELRSFTGNDKLEKVTIENLKSGDVYEKPIDGVFIFIGYKPNTESLKNIIRLNNKNEIVVDDNLQTNIEGVYAAGDCIVKKYRQITTAVADGTVAALNVSGYIHENKNTT